MHNVQFVFEDTENAKLAMNHITEYKIGEITGVSSDGKTISMTGTVEAVSTISSYLSRCQKTYKLVFLQPESIT